MKCPNLKPSVSVLGQHPTGAHISPSDKYRNRLPLGDG